MDYNNRPRKRLAKQYLLSYASQLIDKKQLHSENNLDVVMEL